GAEGLGGLWAFAARDFVVEQDDGMPRHQAAEQAAEEAGTVRRGERDRRAGREAGALQAVGDDLRERVDVTPRGTLLDRAHADRVGVACEQSGEGSDDRILHRVHPVGPPFTLHTLSSADSSSAPATVTREV